MRMATSQNDYSEEHALYAVGTGPALIILAAELWPFQCCGKHASDNKRWLINILKQVAKASYLSIDRAACFLVLKFLQKVVTESPKKAFEKI